jgi:hypothetical protein
MTLMKAHTIINNLRLQERLPSVDMRIKDYSRAPLNGLVVGLDLYEILKKRFPLHSAYHFEEIKEQR